MKTIQIFVNDTLLPCANRILHEKYDEYCSGTSPDVETKSDGSPAGKADRETEAALRVLIESQFPDHGIWGEEYGATRTDREYVWVLDPLDGTREFLAKKPGCFGTLIGLLHRGHPILGAVADPISGKVWISTNEASSTKTGGIVTLAQSTVSCTNPETMFPEPKKQNAIQSIQRMALHFQKKRNCLGFSDVAADEVDVAIEGRLKIHDIVALIPVLRGSGATVIDFDGRDYGSMFFDLTHAETQRYGIIAAANPSLAQEVLSFFS